MAREHVLPHTWAGASRQVLRISPDEYLVLFGSGRYQPAMRVSVGELI